MSERLTESELANMDSLLSNSGGYVGVKDERLQALIATARRESKQAEELARVTARLKAADDAMASQTEDNNRVFEQLNQLLDKHGYEWADDSTYARAFGILLATLTAERDDLQEKRKVNLTAMGNYLKTIRELTAERDAMRATLEQIATPPRRVACADSVRTVVKEAMMAKSKKMTEGQKIANRFSGANSVYRPWLLAKAIDRAIAAALRSMLPPPGHIIDDGGVVRRVLGEFVYTQEGHVAVDGARVYYPNENGNIISWDVSGAGDHIPVEVFYSSRAAAEAASVQKGAKNDGEG